MSYETIIYTYTDISTKSCTS